MTQRGSRAEAAAAPETSAAVDAVLAAAPALAGQLRPAVLLRPATGAPGPRDSSVGGPLLWPLDEPWPTCAGPHVRDVRERLTDQERETWQRIDRDIAERRRARPDRAPDLTEHEAAEMAAVMAGAGALDMVAWERVRLVREESGPGLPMVPLAQIRAADALEAAADLPWPAGSGLLQVLWCPNDHEEPPGAGAADHEGHPGGQRVGGKRYDGPKVAVRFRPAAHPGGPAGPRTDAGAGTDAGSGEDAGATDPGDTAGLLREPPRPDLTDASYLPQPCVLRPLAVRDLPPADGLPEEAAVQMRARSGPDDARSWDLLAPRPGWKLGGWPRRTPRDPAVASCACGTSMRLLLTVESQESGPGVNVGRYGELCVFVCPADPAGHPVGLAFVQG
jgi:hypothetical protein